MLQIEAKIEKIGPVETFGQKNTQKRLVIVRTLENYPQTIAFEQMGKALEAFKDHQPGDSVAITFNLRGREWQGRYFTSVSAWKVEALGNAYTSDSQPCEATGAADAGGFPAGAGDDIPF